MYLFLYNKTEHETNMLPYRYCPRKFENLLQLNRDDVGTEVPAVQPLPKVDP